MKKRLVCLLMLCTFCLTSITPSVFSMDLPELSAEQSRDGSAKKATQVVANEKYVFLACHNEIYIYDKNDIDTPLTRIYQNISSSSSTRKPVERMVLKDDKLIVNFTRASGGNGQPAISVYDVGEVVSGQSMSSKKTGSLSASDGTVMRESEGYLIVRVINGSTKYTNVYDLEACVTQEKPQPIIKRTGLAPQNIYVSGDYLFAREKSTPEVVSVYSLEDLADETKEVSALCNLSVNATLPISAVSVSGQYVSLATEYATTPSANRVFMYDLSNIDSASGYAPLVQQYNAKGRVNALWQNGNILFVSAQEQNSIHLLDVGDIRDIRLLTTIKPPEVDSRGFSFYMTQEFLYVTNYTAGLYAYKLPESALSLYAVQGETRLGMMTEGDVQTKLAFDNYYAPKGVEGKIILATFRSGKLETIDVRDASITAGSGIGEIDLGTVNYKESDDCTVRAFFFDGFETLVPLTEKLELVSRSTNSVNTIYVDGEAGNDENSGGESAPFKTIQRAQQEVRRLNRAMTSDIYVYVKGGTYYLEDTLCFTEQDSGFNGYNVIYQAAEGEEPVISGGEVIDGWSLFDAEKNIYKAPAKGADNRHLYVDGKRAVRARSAGNVTNFVNDGGEEGFTCSNTELLNYENVCDVEFVFKRGWVSRRVHPLRVESVDADTVKVYLSNWDRVNDEDYKAPTGVYYYENAYELLDEEGEFYIDKRTDTVYYKPVSGTDIHASHIVAPKLETIVSISGSSIVKPVHDMIFSGITFKDSTWLSPNTNDFIDAQNLYPEEPLSAVFIKHGNHIRIEKCTIKNCGGDALGAARTVQDCSFIGNDIYDISARGIHIGDWDGSENAKVAADIASGFVVENNYIHAIGEEYYSAPAISGVFIADTAIRHNEIYDVPYSGMHIGWGWDSYETTSIENLVIEHNYIHDFMHTCADGGAVYFLGATGASAENMNKVSKNFFKNAGEGTEAVMYCDSGSKYYQLSDNVIDNHESVWNGYYGLGSHYNEFINNYSTCENFRSVSATSATPVNTMVYPNGNWPQAARTIINEAGLTDEYKYLSAVDEEDFVLRAKQEMAGVSSLVRANDDFAFIKTSDTQISVYDVSDIEALTVKNTIERTIPGADGEKYTIQSMEVKDSSLFVHYRNGVSNLVVLYDVAADGAVTERFLLEKQEALTMLLNSQFLVLFYQADKLEFYELSAIDQNGFVATNSQSFDTDEEIYLDDEYICVVRASVIDVFALSGTMIERIGTCPVTSVGVKSILISGERLYVTAKLPTGHKGNLLIYDMTSLSPDDMLGSAVQLVGDAEPIDTAKVIEELNKSRVVTSVQNEKYIFTINASDKTKIDVRSAVNGETITTISHAMSNTSRNYVFGTMCLLNDRLAVTCKRNSGNGNPKIALYDVSEISEGEALEPLAGIGVYNADNGIVFNNDSYIFCNDVTLGRLYVCSIDDAAQPFKRIVSFYTSSNNMFADNDYLYIHNQEENVVEIYSLANLPDYLSALNRVGVIPFDAEELNEIVAHSSYPSKSMCLSGDYALVANPTLGSIFVTNTKEDGQSVLSLGLYETGNTTVGLWAHKNYIYALEEGQRLLIYERKER